MPQHVRGAACPPSPAGAGSVASARAVAQRVVAQPARSCRPRFLRSDGNSGAPGRVWSSSNRPHTSSMNQRSVRSAPLISGTIRARGPDPARPCRSGRGACRTGPAPTSRPPGPGGGPRSPAARPRPSAWPPRSSAPSARTCGTSPAPPAHPANSLVTCCVARRDAQPSAAPGPGAGSSHRPGTAPPGRSAGAARPGAAAPGTRSRSLSACDRLRRVSVRPRRASPPRSTRPRRPAPSPTAAGRTRPAPAPARRARRGSCRVGQPRRRPGQHEPGQHVGLEVLDFLLGQRRLRLAHVPDYCQAQPSLPLFTATAHRSQETIWLHAS